MERSAAGSAGGPAHLKEAEQLLRDALTIQRASLGPFHRDVGMTLIVLAVVLEQQIRPRMEIVGVLFQAIPVFIRQPDGHLLGTAIIEAQLGTMARARRDLGAAERHWRKVLAMVQGFLGDKHVITALVRLELGGVIADQGRPADAEAFVRDSVFVLGKVFPRVVAKSLGRLADYITERGDFDEALTLRIEQLSICRRLWGSGSGQEALVLLSMASDCLARGNLIEARQTLMETQDLLAKLPDPSNSLVHDEARDALLIVTAECLEAEGDLKSAEAAFRDSSSGI